MKRTTIVAGGAMALLSTTVALGATASAAAADQGQADAAIAAFSDQVTGAGFESTGPGNETDLLGLRPSEDEEDPTAAATNACVADLAQFVAEDGTFVGETARATSDAFALSPDGPPSTDPFAISQYDEISAVVAFVDDPEGITQIIDAFGSGDPFDCMMAAISSVPSSSDVPMPEVSFDEQELDLGDQAVQVDSLFSFSFEGEELTFGVTIAMARVDRAVAIVSYDSNGEPLSDLTAADALATMVDALG